MPRKKRSTDTAAKTTAAKTTASKTAAAETAPVEAETVETAPVEAAPAVEETPKRGRKPAAKKAETAKPAEETPKKRTRKTAAEKKTAEENVVIQFMGSAVTASELIAKAKADCGVDSPETVDVYVKPEENMVYYVVDGVTGKFSLV